VGIVHSVSQSGGTERKSVRTVGSRHAVRWRACARPWDRRFGVFFSEGKVWKWRRSEERTDVK